MIRFETETFLGWNIRMDWIRAHIDRRSGRLAHWTSVKYWLVAVP